MVQIKKILSAQQRGQAAEEAAAHFLSEQGYAILNRNERTRLGEIDIIAQDGEILVFVEVRSRHQANLGHPQETINGLKKARLRRLAQQYLARRSNLEMLCRFDVVGVIIDLYGVVQSIELIQNAF